MPDERTLFDRLLSAQQRIGAISKDQTNPHFNHKYADINAILKMVKPILNDEGLLLMQALTHVDGKAAIKTTIMCADAKIEDTTVIPDPPTPKEGKRGNPFQDMGSAFTYYRRYTIAAMLALEAEDDDGNAASQPNTPPKEQPKAQPQQAGSAKEIPTCSICHQPMKPQANNPDKFYCKHTGENGQTKWGNPMHSKQKKVA